MSWYTRTFLLLMKSIGISHVFLLPMKRNDKVEQISYHNMSLYTRTVLLLMKSNGVSEIFLLPMKRNDKLEQFCCS